MKNNKGATTMKKLFITAVMILATATTIFAAGIMERDLNRNIIQGAAPDGNLSQLLTVNATTIDMTSTLWWDLYPPSTGCKYRLMPLSTSTKSLYPQFTVPDGTKTGYVINRNTAFVNFSGCTSAELQRM